MNTGPKTNPEIIDDLKTFVEIRRALKASRSKIGFVPTMGALHAGHASLLQRCREENDVVVLSIYVNPTQFDNNSDLQNYPISLDRDIKVAEESGVDFILLPDYEQMYPDEYAYKVTESRFSQQLCGAHRPGHFDGVLTVVMKLLNLVQANRAYFGEKDFQQLQLIKGMTEAFFMDTEIIPCATVREVDGLAMSSRNLNLSREARMQAPLFYRALEESSSANEARARLLAAGFEVDYIEDIGARRFGAVKISGVRLIDNVER